MRAAPISVPVNQIALTTSSSKPAMCYSLSYESMVADLMWMVLKSDRPKRVRDGELQIRLVSQATYPVALGDIWQTRV